MAGPYQTIYRQAKRRLIHGQTSHYHTQGPYMSLSRRLFIALQYVLPHHALSRLVGRLARCEHPGFKNALIRWFIRRFDVDMAQAERQQPEQYQNFNYFFTRALVEGARPIDDSEHGIACPADGAISQLGTIKYGRIFQAK